LRQAILHDADHTAQIFYIILDTEADPWCIRPSVRALIHAGLGLPNARQP
jgi:hypothetical protein